MTDRQADKFEESLKAPDLSEGSGQVFDLLQALGRPIQDDAFFRQVVESIADSVVIHRHGRIIYANPSAIATVGAGRLDDLAGLPSLDFIAPEDRQKVGDVIQCVMRQGGASPITSYTGVSVDGSRRDIETIAVQISSKGGAATLNVCRDVTERNQTERALRNSEARFRTFAEHSPEATVAICDRCVVIANRAAAQLLGVDDTDALLGRDVLDFCHRTIQDQAYREFHALEQGDGVPKQSHGKLCSADGAVIDVEWTSIPFTFSGKPAVYLIFRDVTERLQNEERHRYLASHDALTGLPNRLEFQHRLKSMAKEAKSGQARFAIHYLDLDYFKTINDTLGHHVGDQLLQTVATRLRRAVRASDIVARLGGDEFAVLQRDLNQVDAPRKLAKKLQEAIEQPYTIGDELLHTSVTIGIAVFPNHGDDPKDLLRRADLALYRAKDSGRNAVSFYSDDLDVQVRERDTLITQLVRAEAREEFDVFFQPIATLCSGRFEAVEALLRWHHPERGLLSADAFIHAIEVSREAQRIGAWVLCRACEYAKRWETENHTDLRVAVNLSMPLLQRPDLVDLVKSCLAKFDLEPSKLELELTERMVITAGASGLERKLLELHELGVCIALDDFGTGYSSLALLKDLPIDRIKIDRSFIAGFGTNADDTSIVRAITHLGQSMNKRVTAEGVENADTLALLRSEGCHEIQGFHLARPMPATDIAGFLKTFRADRASAHLDEIDAAAMASSNA